MHEREMIQTEHVDRLFRAQKETKVDKWKANVNCRQSIDPVPSIRTGLVDSRGLDYLANDE